MALYCALQRKWPDGSADAYRRSNYQISDQRFQARRKNQKKKYTRTNKLCCHQWNHMEKEGLYIYIYIYIILNHIWGLKSSNLNKNLNRYLDHCYIVLYLHFRLNSNIFLLNFCTFYILSTYLENNNFYLGDFESILNTIQRKWLYIWSSFYSNAIRVFLSFSLALTRARLTIQC